MSNVWEDTYQAPERGNAMAPAPAVAAPEHGGLDLSFFFSIAASLGTVVDELRRGNDRADRAFDRIPYDVPILGQGVTNDSGAVTIACNGPSLGRQWQVRQLAIVGVTTGAAQFYALPAPPSSGQGLGFKDAPTKTTWPVARFYGTHQFIVNVHERIYVVVTGATDTTEIIVTGTAEDYALDDQHLTETL